MVRNLYLDSYVNYVVFEVDLIRSRHSSLSFRSKRDNIIEQRRNILKRSYDLSGSISLLSQVIHSLRVKVNIAEKKDHPKLWLWAKKWIEKKPTRLVEDM